MPHTQTVSLSPTFPVEVADVRDNRPPHVLVCVHGIRDDGAWCNTHATAFGEFLNSEIEIVCVRYDRVSSYGFLFGYKAEKIRADVVGQIEYIRTSFPNSPLSVLCHSNGTKVIADIIEDLDFKFDWLFLCGSVCHIRDVNKLRQIIRTPVNDVGIKDWWPILAEAFRPSMFGATGVCGFNRFPIKDRSFSYFHGGGITENHIKDWILPTLSTGRIRSTPAIDAGIKKHMSTYLRYSFFALPLALFALYLLTTIWITIAAIIFISMAFIRYLLARK